MSGPWILVTQVKSNRVVYFTDDADYTPAMDGDWYYVSQHVGDLPAGMTLRNCWGWRYNGGVFTDAREKSKKPRAETLLDANRRALRRILADKIEEWRRPHLPSSPGGFETRRLKRIEARAFRDGAHPTGEAEPGWLASTAAARGVSVAEAADLILARATETDRVLQETEVLRERLERAADAASDQATLVRQREEILTTVLPQSTPSVRLPVDATRPVDRAAVLPELHRRHQQARLRVMLQLALANARRPPATDTVGQDEMWRYKVRLARALLEIFDTGGDVRVWAEADPEGAALLSAAAKARGVPLFDAARELVAGAAAAHALLLRTETVRDEVLAAIDALRSLEDIHGIEKWIGRLSA